MKARIRGSVPPANPAYKEILVLEEMLTNAGIPHEKCRVDDGWVIGYPQVYDADILAFECSWSSGANGDLLELVSLLTHEEEKVGYMVGHVTAADVFERAKANFERGHGNEGED